MAFENDEGDLHTAAESVSFELDRGETLCLVGESGSGKSTVAMSIPRLLPSPPSHVTGGEIWLDGQELVKMPVKELRHIRGAKIGVVFQDPMDALSPLHNVGDQLMETVLLHRDISKAAARAMALEWLEKVGIPQPELRLKALPHELSGGMRQRVMIAMALMLEPDLLIADEPTTALDVTVQAQVLRLMKRLCSNKNGVLFITHDMGVVSQMATRLCVMKNGRIVEKSTDPAAFFKSPVHPYSKELLAAAS
ncbi:MAG: ABC transporter ATP-binding protein [Kiritimatiellae bacterium]|nr:ABC transporter ATP-binding protein [Kiritimatiellia bacterium]